MGTYISRSRKWNLFCIYTKLIVVFNFAEDNSRYILYFLVNAYDCFFWVSRYKSPSCYQNLWAKGKALSPILSWDTHLIVDGRVISRKLVEGWVSSPRHSEYVIIEENKLWRYDLFPFIDCFGDHKLNLGRARGNRQGQEAIRRERIELGRLQKDGVHSMRKLTHLINVSNLFRDYIYLQAVNWGLHIWFCVGY